MPTTRTRHALRWVGGCIVALLLAAGCQQRAAAPPPPVERAAAQPTQPDHEPPEGHSMQPPAADLPDFDALWDYNKPAETERAFAELLPRAEASGDASYHLQLLTQVARAQGLQGKFDDAHATLDGVEAQLEAAPAVVRVRYLLERGRAFNSDKQPEKARPLFTEAWDAARAAGLDGLAVDAAHMVAIVAPPEESLAWNEKAMQLALASDDPKAQKWVGSLCNNIGWTYHDAGRYEEALEQFRQALKFREGQGDAGNIRVARWCVARCLRSLERIDEALATQQALLAELDAAGETDGFVHEELAECLLAQGRAEEARRHFALAYAELSKDAWFVENEAERLARAKKLGGVE